MVTREPVRLKLPNRLLPIQPHSVAAPAVMTAYPKAVKLIERNVTTARASMILKVAKWHLS